MKPFLRTYKDRDANTIVELMGQLGYEHSTRSVIANIGGLRRSGSEVFVVEDDGKVLSCISAIIDVRLAEGTKGEIVSLVVSDNARGRGLGRELYHWFFITIFERYNQAGKFYIGNC